MPQETWTLVDEPKEETWTLVETPLPAPKNPNIAPPTVDKISVGGPRSKGLFGQALEENAQSGMIGRFPPQPGGLQSAANAGAGALSALSGLASFPASTAVSAGLQIPVPSRISSPMAMASIRMANQVLGAERCLAASGGIIILASADAMPPPSAARGE